MTACRCQLQCAYKLPLTLKLSKLVARCNLRKINTVRFYTACRSSTIRILNIPRNIKGRITHRTKSVLQRISAVNLHPRNLAGLIRVLHRHNAPHNSTGRRRRHSRVHPLHGPHPSGQLQFTHHEKRLVNKARKPVIYSFSSQHSQRNRQVKTSPFLFEIRGGQGNENPFRRVFKARISDGRLHTFPRLFNSPISQPDNIRGGYPPPQINFNSNQSALVSKG